MISMHIFLFQLKRIKQVLFQIIQFSISHLFALGLNRWLGGFYGISTLVGYLMPNPFYTNKEFYFKQFGLVKQF